MKDIKITVVKKTEHKDLMDRYENPISHACDLKEGQVFISKEGQMPNGMCNEAWKSLFPYVFALSNGACDFYDGWMKDKYSAMISCNDGFRPVSFYIEVIK